MVPGLASVGVEGGEEKRRQGRSPLTITILEYDRGDLWTWQFFKADFLFNAFVGFSDTPSSYY